LKRKDCDKAENCGKLMLEQEEEEEEEEDSLKLLVWGT
jgi:hypothetical protein